MSEQDYYHKFMQDIYARAGTEEDFCEEIFTEVMCDFLVIETFDSTFYK
jgi:hypothetical protein